MNFITEIARSLSLWQYILIYIATFIIAIIIAFIGGEKSQNIREKIIATLAFLGANVASACVYVKYEVHANLWALLVFAVFISIISYPAITISDRFSKARNTEKSIKRINIIELFKPFWKLEYSWERKEKIEKIDDENKLTKIVLNSKTREFRECALKKITNRAVLAKVALEDSDKRIRKAAVKKLTDQSVLAKVALEDSDKKIRIAAVKKLTDQTVLAKLALEGSDSNVRIAAVKELTDQVMLAKFAFEDSDKKIRKAAVKKLTDQSVLDKLVLEGSDSDVRIAAVKELTDQVMLAKLALEGSDSDVRIAAVKKLTDQAVLAEVALNENIDIDERFAAVIKLKNKYGDAAPYQTLQQLGIKILNGHNLYRTVYKEWEQVEYFCLCCGKTGGETEDDGGTHHYGCHFYKEPCKKA